MESKKTIKKSKALDDVKAQKESKDLKDDVKGYFAERDKNNRGGNGKIEDVVAVSKAEAEVKDLLYKVSMDIHPLPEGIEPMFNSIFLSAKRNKVRTSTGLMLAASLLDGGMEVDFQEVQTVMAHGPQVQQAKTGCEVVINFESMRVKIEDTMADKVNKESKINVPIIQIDGRDYINISERDLKYILKKA